jgi:hypothetical protein
MRYEIRVKGQLDQRWATWFDDMQLIAEANGDTVIAGNVVDQSALHSLLGKVLSLNLTLISLTRIQDDADATQGSQMRMSDTGSETAERE